MCAFSLRNFGVTKLLKKNEEPKYHKKKVIAHPDDELDVLYGAADAEETFLLAFVSASDRFSIIWANHRAVTRQLFYYLRPVFRLS